MILNNRRLNESLAEEDKIEFYFNNKKLNALKGEPIAVALLANDIQSIRTCDVTGENRGVYCGIGHCYECRAVVNNTPNVRTCLTPVEQGMEVFSSAKDRQNRGEA